MAIATMLLLVHVIWNIFLACFFALYQIIITFKKKNIPKKCKKKFKKNVDFWTFRGKPTLYPPGGRVNIMADANFLATYLKIGVDYEFDIETTKFNYTSFHFRAVLT
jgi:hypothetical protein